MAVQKEGCPTLLWAGIVVESMTHKLGVFELCVSDDSRRCRETWLASAESVSPTL